MKERLKRILPKIGYPLFYLFCLAIFFSVTFPYEKLKERIVTSFNAQQKASSSPTELQIDELDSSFVTGIKAKGVRLLTPSSDPTKGPVELKIDEARARISLLGLLIGNKDVTFRLDAFDGVIKGAYSDSGKQREIEVEFENVDISKIDAIAANAGVPFEGRLGGTLKLQLPEGKASKAGGAVNLQIKDMVAGNAKELQVKTPLGPFTLPRLRVGTFDVTGTATDGVLKITKLGASDGDVNVQGDGRVQLKEVATDALLDANLKFKINDSYRKKNDKTKLLFGDPDKKDKPMLEMDPNIGKSKSADGFYQMKISGKLGKPETKFGSGGAKGASDPFGAAAASPGGSKNFNFNKDAPKDDK